MTSRTLFEVAPTALGAAREISHAAIQWPSRAARANLAPASDDSHSNLGWSDAVFGLLSHPLDPRGRFQLGFSYRGGTLLWLQNGQVVTSVEVARLDAAAAAQWCDAQLQSAGLRPLSAAQMPYELAPISYSPLGSAAGQAALATLGAWYAAAQVELQRLAQQQGTNALAPAAVRCWPHHYDLAVLFALEAGDPETARSVGVGLSPGDGTFAEPYLYCTPWPAPAALGAPPFPWHWHRDGFTALVCPASALGAQAGLEGLLLPAFEHARSILASG